MDGKGDHTMDEEKRTRTGTRRTTFAVLEILKTDTRPDEICCKCSPKNERYQYQYYYRTDIPIQLQENIRTIHETIRKNRGRGKAEHVLSFQFNGYGSDKALHPNYRISGVLPLRVMAALGTTI